MKRVSRDDARKKDPRHHDAPPEKVFSAISAERSLRDRMAEMAQQHALEMRSMEDRLALAEKIARSLRQQLAACESRRH